MSDKDKRFNGMNRRRYLEAVTLAGLTGLAGCTGNGSGGNETVGGGSNETVGGGGNETVGGGGNETVGNNSTSGSGPDYSSYQDVSITFATSSNYIDAWDDLASRFTDATGIKVETTSYAQSEMLTKLQNQLRSQQAEFDAFISDVIWTGTLIDPGWTEPLDSYMNDSSLAMEGYDYGDHLDVYATNYGQWNDTIYGLPWYGDKMKLSVRKDVLSKHAEEFNANHDFDIMPPFPQGYENYQQFNEVARWMHKEKDWQMGLEGRRGWNLVYYYPNRFAAETGETSMLDDQGNSRLGSDGAQSALQIMVDQTEWARDPLSTGYTQSRDQFLNGDTWAVEQWGTATTKFIDKYGWEDGVRVTLTPGGYPNLGGWGILINSFADQNRKEAAFLLAQWATSKKIDKYTMREHGVTPTRASSFTDQLKEKAPQLHYQDPEENPGVKSLSVRPRNPNYQELGDTMQTQISKALSGSTGVEKAITSIHNSWQNTMST
jgi:ABC-type glycerol-3-phosphate transport system substrate-binding protein